MKVNFSFEMSDNEFAQMTAVIAEGIRCDEHRERTQMAGRTVDQLVRFADHAVDKALTGWDYSKPMPGLAEATRSNKSYLSSIAQLLPLFAQMMSEESSFSDAPADSTDTPAAHAASDEANEDAE